MIVGLCAVPLLAVITGVVEMQDISGARSQLQAAVDSGALAGAQRMTIASSGSSSNTAASTAITTASTNYGNNASTATFTVTMDPAKGSLTLTGAARHKPLIGFLGFGDVQLTASATADALGSIPLCILQTGTDTKAGLHVQDHAVIHATGCAVQANKDIKVDPQAMIQSARTEAVGTIIGPVTPAGFSGALPIDDPFASLNLNPSFNCIGKPIGLKVLQYTTLLLPPGIHCENYDVETNAVLQLLPGEHYFMDNLEAHKNSVIQGNDVVLIFGSTETISFADQATIRLTARKTGPFAGFLIATSRKNTEKFTIASNNVSDLLGTIYIPSATLVVDTTGNVAQDSAWSIIVADSLQMNHNPNLVMNTGYAGSGVPVPTGVGPSGTKVTLVQ
ncbi:MAG: Tad domain-containing protein [Asticcacaulis sp.]